MKRALITGVTGQDGSYLAELLLKKGYEMCGAARGDKRHTDGVKFIKGDVRDEVFIRELVSKKFDEIYNLASVSTVQNPWEDPVGTVASTGLVPLYFLEAIRTLSPSTRFFQASSAEMFGDPATSSQNENTPFHPENPYGLGKLLAHLAVGQYREQHNLFAVSGILFNHESPRRGEGFVTRKITRTLAHTHAGLEKELVVGNLNTMRDWGFAGDYVEAMWMMLQADVPEDYVIASGETHTVRDFIETAARVLGLDIAREGEGNTEVGKDTNGTVIVRVSKEFFRPIERVDRRGDISKIQKNVGWKPKTLFEELVRMMVETDVTHIVPYTATDRI